MMTRRLILIFLFWVGLPQGASAFKCMPVYGNWCGPDYPPAGQYPPPVDPFDAACMRHDLCTDRFGDRRACDRALLQELHGLAATLGSLPRPLQWAEYLLRVRLGGPWTGMPLPTPGDAIGVLSSLAAPCW